MISKVQTLNKQFWPTGRKEQIGWLWINNLLEKYSFPLLLPSSSTPSFCSSFCPSPSLPPLLPPHSLIPGVGGNLVAVQASRISTSLHQTGSLGTPPSDPSQQYRGPLKTFFSSSEWSLMNGGIRILCFIGHSTLTPSPSRPTF